MRRCSGLVIGLARLAAVMLPIAASAQERPKIEIVPRVPHTDVVSSAAFSPDGAKILSGSADNTLKLWDAATARLIRTFVGHSRVVGAAAFSSDGTRVLSGSDDETMKLWDAATGRLIRTFDGDPGRVSSATFSPDGARVLSIGHRRNGGSTVKLWETATGRVVRTFEEHLGEITSVAFSHDGRRIISGGRDGTTRIWDADSGGLLATLLATVHGEWVTVTPEGFFDASGQGGNMLSIVRGLEIFSIDRSYEVLHRPDLVRAKLAGDAEGKVKAAAAELESKLELK